MTLETQSGNSDYEMDECNRTVRPGFARGTVISDTGEVLNPPTDWVYLAAGDGPLTRLVKSRTVCWQVQAKMGRRTINKGIWAAGDQVEAARAELLAKRATPEHARQLAASQKRRAEKQQGYVEDFLGDTLAFLDFHPAHRQLAEQLAEAVTRHATPVGSGTVARTERIPLRQRVEAAVIAWMRHQTTAYERMQIARIRGRRREVRRLLAERSKVLLERYRKGEPADPACPLAQALSLGNLPDQSAPHARR
jgi:hypothetical protein